MSLTFKCVVNYKSNNYFVNFHNNGNEVTLNTVLNHFKSQINEEISLETHLFELLDNDFNKLIVIRSYDHIIDKFSRIIVSLVKESQELSQVIKKIVEKQSKTLNISPIKENVKIDVISEDVITGDEQVSQTTGYLAKTSDKFEINSEISVYNNSYSEKLIDINDEEIDKSTENVNHDNQICINTKANDSFADPNSPKEQILHNSVSNAFNFIGLFEKVNSGPTLTRYGIEYEIKTENMGDFSLVVIKFNPKHLKVMIDLIETVVNNAKTFITCGKSNNLLTNNKWEVVSNDMIKKGHKCSIPYRCYQLFYLIIQMYHKLLERSPNREVASACYPMFDLIHSLDLSPYLNDVYNNKLVHLRKVFQITSEKFQMKDLIKVKNNYPFIDSRERLIDISNSETKLNQTCEVEESYESIVCITKPNTEILANNDYLKPALNYFYDFDQNCWQNDPNFGLKFNNLGIKYEIKVEIIRDIPIYVMRYDTQDLIAYTDLFKSMVKNTKYFMTYENRKNKSLDKWTVVSNDIVSRGHNDWTPSKCSNGFYISLQLYSKLLITSPNHEIASTVYQLFDLIHKLDLFPFITNAFHRNLINQKKHFALKCAKFSTELIVEQYNKLDFTSDDFYMNIEDQNDELCVRNNLSINSYCYDIKDEDKCNFRHTLYQRGNNMNDYYIQSFYSLVAIVSQVMGQSDRLRFESWVSISKMMIDLSFKNFDIKKCANIFYINICDNYPIALQCCDNFKTALSLYPLFGIIYALDLKKFIDEESYEKVVEYRKVFDEKMLQNN